MIRGEYSGLGLFEPYEGVAISTEASASAVQSKRLDRQNLENSNKGMEKNERE